MPIDMQFMLEEEKLPFVM